MACELKLAYDFFFSFLWCSLPRDTTDIELAVRTVQGIHTFRKITPLKQQPAAPGVDG